MQIENFTQELIRLRRHFHQYPELALQEYETSAYVRRYLEKMGYTITEVPPTGLIAELPDLQNREKMVVVRAEMDALPITEKTGLPYAADNGCMHACGHDCIIASALILAKIVAKEQEDFPVRVRFLFEPAEEIRGRSQTDATGRCYGGAQAGCLYYVSLCLRSAFWNGSPSGTGFFYDQQYGTSCPGKIQPLV